MSFWERVRSEVREIGLVTLYFLASYSLFLVLKKLFLEEYDVEVAVLSTVVIAALVTAKVVVLLGKTSFGTRFRERTIVAHILYRSITYTGAVLVVTALERVFDAYRELGHLDEALAHAWGGRDVDHFLAMNLAIAVSFLVYNTYAEIDDYLGEGSLRRFFFSKRGSVPSPPS